MNIYISGLYSGPNPSPGLGIARSLRLAYPDATLIGVDYSPRSTGLHWPDFDEIWIQRPWNELDLEEYQQQIRDILDSGSLWISGLDLEIIWLARTIGFHPSLLIPPSSALRKIAKPAITAAKILPFKIPPFIYTRESDWDLYAFCRKHGWLVWLKGPYYEARRVRSWLELKQARFDLSQTWSTTSELFLQAHVSGHEECIALCAYRGKLLDCVWMIKRDITPEGKTWAGRVSDVPEEVLYPLRKIVADLNWTGGAELEMIRDPSGNLWLIEWNPRFPAWIHGATIAGHNLPASLVKEATGVPPKEMTANSPEFVRVVLEIPTRPQFPLLPLPEPPLSSFGLSLKHPSGMPILARQLPKTPEENGFNSFAPENAPPESAPNVPITILDDLKNYDLNSLLTPSRLFLNTTAQIAFRRASNIMGRFSSSQVRVFVAYSIKTNPDDCFLELAREHNFLAEAISQCEVQKALSKGFAPDQIVLNGPGKWWPSGATPIPLKAIFCDSLEELEGLLQRISNGIHVAEIIGVRLRPPQVTSRFGVSVSDHQRFKQLVSLIGNLPSEYLLGVHFHIASSTIGTNNWWHVYESMLRWAKAIQITSGKKIQCLDIGGGWFPDDWVSEFEHEIEGAISRASLALPELQVFILEPGKALVQPSMVLCVRVLEVRKAGGHIEEVVVDGSIAELPESPLWPHRVLIRDSTGQGWEPLRRGNARIMGRLCMEDDILAENIHIPKHVQVGDILIFCDAGAYDRSMSYEFGKG